MASAQFTALVLAAGRSPRDEVAEAAGVANKCLAEVGGAPILIRVLRALRESGCVDRIFVSTDDEALLLGEPEFGALVADGEVALVGSASSAPDSVSRAAKEIPSPFPLLVTTGDHALLSPEMVRYFCNGTEGSDADLTVGLAAASVIMRRFPETRRTFLRFREEAYSGCNLFALMSPAALPVLAFWAEAERHRKAPYRLVWTFGLTALILFALGVLTLRQALARASRKLGASISPVIMPQPEAAIDVDKPSDLDLARRILSGER